MSCIDNPYNLSIAYGKCIDTHSYQIENSIHESLAVCQSPCYPCIFVCVCVFSVCVYFIDIIFDIIDSLEM